MSRICLGRLARENSTQIPLSSWDTESFVGTIPMRTVLLPDGRRTAAGRKRLRHYLVCANIMNTRGPRSVVNW